MLAFLTRKVVQIPSIVVERANYTYQVLCKWKSVKHFGKDLLNIPDILINKIFTLSHKRTIYLNIDFGEYKYFCRNSNL